MASLLQQGKPSHKEEQPPSGQQGEGKGDGEKQQRESTSSTEDGQSRGDEKREKGSAEEGGEKGREAGRGGGEKAAARSAGAERREHKPPSSAEMMHRQQLEYQRYRYVVRTVAVLSCARCFLLCCVY